MAQGVIFNCLCKDATFATTEATSHAGVGGMFLLGSFLKGENLIGENYTAKKWNFP